MPNPRRKAPAPVATASEPELTAASEPATDDARPAEAPAPPQRSEGGPQRTEGAPQRLNITTLKDKSIHDLTQIAKELNVSGATGMRKQELIFQILKAQTE